MAWKPVEKWLEDDWSPLRVVWGTVTGVLTIASVAAWVRERHHPGGVWYLTAAFLLVALLAAEEALRWRTKHHRAITEKNSKSVSRRHLRDLQNSARKLAATVAANGVGDFCTTAENLSLRGHFPELYDQFSIWKNQILLRDVYPRFVGLYIDNELRKKNVAYPVLKVVNFSTYMARVIQNRVEQGLSWNSFFDFNWKEDENGDIEIPAYGVVIDCSAADAAGLTTQECKEAIEGAFREQHHWLDSKFDGIKSKIREVGPSLQVKLEVVSTMYEVTGECPSCNQELLSQVKDVL